MFGTGERAYVNADHISGLSFACGHVHHVQNSSLCFKSRKMHDTHTPQTHSHPHAQAPPGAHAQAQAHARHVCVCVSCFLLPAFELACGITREISQAGKRTFC